MARERQSPGCSAAPPSSELRLSRGSMTCRSGLTADCLGGPGGVAFRVEPSGVRHLASGDPQSVPRDQLTELELLSIVKTDVGNSITSTGDFLNDLSKRQVGEIVNEVLTEDGPTRMAGATTRRRHSGCGQWRSGRQVRQSHASSNVPRNGGSCKEALAAELLRPYPTHGPANNWAIPGQHRTGKRPVS